MTDQCTDSPQIRSLVDKGIAKLASERYSHEFNNYISQNYPWSGFGICWSDIENYTQVDTAHLSEEELKSFFDETTLGHYNIIAVIYGADEPCLLIGYPDMVKYFDDLIISTVQCYFVGVVERNLEEIQYIYHDFVEFYLSSKSLISGVKRQ